MQSANDIMAQELHHATVPVSAPRHPVATLQGPFEESMLESVGDESEADVYLDPITRRNTLLEAPVYTRVVAGRWKQKPGERFHPLWKLIAQISFGIHLLAEGMAKSEDDVMQILQAHVDEIDGFLERTTEDFDLAGEDIQERLRCLKLPLSHPATFEKMLEDRNFRLSIVEGNEKIEHIVERTTQAMKDSLKDVQKGFDSTSCLETYLQGLSNTWQRLSVEHEAVFVAMLGNVEGWRKAFLTLHVQGNKLNGSLKKLTDIINEMQARAGEVSRRLLHQAKVQHNTAMGRPSGRSTPTSRFQAVPSKQLPGMPGRPSLRQTVSNETVRSKTSQQSSSRESLRHQALLGRAQTPQHEMPAPRQVNNANSPRIIQIGANSQARVQSMVPSLLENLPSSPSPTPPTETPPADTEEQPERYFPPIELPAHVPQETMRQAPMSKQNRFSIGLGLGQEKTRDRTDKRNSRLGTSALVDLLRTNPITDKLSNTPKTKSPEASRRTSTTKSGSNADDSSSSGKAQTSTVRQSRSTSVNDETGLYAKTNVRRPKKGVQHWFDAIDNDSAEDVKYSVQDTGGGSVKETTLTVRSTPKLDHNDEPGTPAWAVTTFAQVEKKKELLKKGAFSSHPPDLPLGSPPLTQKASFQNPVAVVAPQRRPSHASSAGHSTLGEPGPTIAASEAGSASAHSAGRGHSRNVDKRASSVAPEVVIANMPPLPLPRKEFIAEMEGSIPTPSGMPISTRGIVMELEAPQQHFILPPRPQSSTAVKSSGMPPGPQKALLHQPHFVLPPRPQSTPPAQVSTGTVASQSRETAATETHLTNREADHELAMRPPSDAPPAIPAEFIRESRQPEEQQTEQVQATPDITTEGTGSETNDIVEQYVDAQENQERLSSAVFLATPGIPLPPSPLVDEELEAQHEDEQPLYILPALTYKAPLISPRLPPDPVLISMRSDHTAPPPQDLIRISSFEHKAPSEGQEGTSTVSEAKESAKQANLSENPAMGGEQAGMAAETSMGPPSEEPDLEAKLSKSTPQQEYDPFKPEDNGLAPAEISSPKDRKAPRIDTSKIGTTQDIKGGTSMVRDRKPENLLHKRESSHGTQNGWKAFFTGQPSPVGSNLSIRSIKRESLMEQPTQSSPGLLSPSSVSSRHQLPPSPVADSVKEAVWYNRPLDDAETSSKRGSNAESTMKEPAGLGISTLDDNERAATQSISTVT